MSMNKWTNEALRMRPYIQKGIQTLNDSDALAIKTVYPKWDASSVYSVSDKVQYNGILYKCLQSHTSQESWNPIDAASMWAEVLIPDDDIIHEWKQPESTNPYMKGDKVIHNDKTWISDVDNNVWEPGVAGWSEL